MKNITACIVLALAVVTPLLSQTQDPADLDAEIKRVRKELMQVQEERERTIAEMEKDGKEFEEYRSRTLKRLRQVRSETDSINADAAIYKARNDSLAALVDAERARKCQFELLQSDFRAEMQNACDRFARHAARFPPGASSKALSALNLLENDLATKSIDNVEAVTRFYQITRDMHESSAAIQIVQGSSPTPELRGTTYRIRLGTFFEAVVNTQGNRAALWSGWDESGNATWKVIADPAVAGQILKAVNVREGKALPALVELPFEDIAVAKGEQ